MFPRTRKHRLAKYRKGVAVAEAAICIPVVLLLVFGTLELCQLIFIKERASICAFEGARVGVKRRADRDDAYNAAHEMMLAFGFEKAQFDVIVTPADFEPLEALEPIAVRVEVYLTGAPLLLGSTIGTQTIRSTVRMAREFDD